MALSAVLERWFPRFFVFDVHDHVAFLGGLADNHALVALVAGRNEQAPALLKRVQRVGHGFARGHSDHAAVLAPGHLAEYGPYSGSDGTGQLLRASR